MTNRHQSNKEPEGYVYSSYGDESYLKYAVISARTIRRYDRKRPIALVCSEEHRDMLDSRGLKHPFDTLIILRPEHRSITGFKHHLHEYMPFGRNLYLDSDMIWCRNPDPVWTALKPYPYTITGLSSADVFFGSRKNFGIMIDILLGRRQRTLRRFGLSYLARVQTGIMYAADYETTRDVNEQARAFHKRKSETHFISRKNERGRVMESCEWSLGMAMSHKNLFVYPWFNAQESIQLDYIDHQTHSNEDFTRVSCKYYCNPFIHSLRGIRNRIGRLFVYYLLYPLPRSQDHMWVTPYVLHFGWQHQKSYFDAFVEREWKKLGPSTRR